MATNRKASAEVQCVNYSLCHWKGKRQVLVNRKTIRPLRKEIERILKQHCPLCGGNVIYVKIV